MSALTSIANGSPVVGSANDAGAAQHDTLEQMHLIAGEELMSIDIEWGAGEEQRGVVVVHFGDDPAELARAFVVKYDLKPNSTNHIREHIEQTIADFRHENTEIRPQTPDDSPSSTPRRSHMSHNSHSLAVAVPDNTQTRSGINSGEGEPADLPPSPEGVLNVNVSTPTAVHARNRVVAGSDASFGISPINGGQNRGQDTQKVSGAPRLGAGEGERDREEEEEGESPEILVSARAGTGLPGHRSVKMGMGSGTGSALAFSPEAEAASVESKEGEGEVGIKGSKSKSKSRSSYDDDDKNIDENDNENENETMVLGYEEEAALERQLLAELGQLGRNHKDIGHEGHQGSGTVTDGLSADSDERDQANALALLEAEQQRRGEVEDLYARMMSGSSSNNNNNKYNSGTSGSSKGKVNVRKGEGAPLDLSTLKVSTSLNMSGSGGISASRSMQMQGGKRTAHDRLFAHSQQRSDKMTQAKRVQDHQEQIYLQENLYQMNDTSKALMEKVNNTTVRILIV